MTDLFKFLVNCFWKFYNLLNDEVVFDFFGFEVSIMGLFVGFIVLGFVVSVFWKGVKS